MNTHIADIQLNSQATILQAIQTMEQPPKHQKPAGIVLVVGENGKLMGVVTDGDIRRAILAGVGLDQTIDRIMNRNPITVSKDEFESGSYSEVLTYLQRSRRLADPTHGKIIVVDAYGHVIGLISLFELLKRESVRTQTICVVGMGQVGLTLAVALAEVGLTVYGVEVNTLVLEMLRVGELHIHEAGLQRTFQSHLGKRLFVEANIAEAGADIYLICVGTPVDEKGEPLFQDLEAASRSVAAVLKRGDLVGVRSTVPVGTSRETVLSLLEQGSGLVGGRDFDFVFAPERTVTGNALAELRSLPQVIGSVNDAGLARASALFRELTPLVITVASLEEAEAVKLLNNTFRDHVFAFSNEVALIFARWGLDTSRVIRAANEDYPRNPIPQAGPGVGGVCLRKDAYFLLSSARRVGYEPSIVGLSRRVNEYMPHYVYEHIMRFLDVKGKIPGEARVFIVGFAFKGEPETSDMRDSSTLDLVQLLRPKIGALMGFDPVVAGEDLARAAGVKACSVDAGFQGSDCVVIMNNHRSYLRWNVYDLLTAMNRPALFWDGWRLFEASDICKVEGIQYGSIGIDYTGASTGQFDV